MAYSGHMLFIASVVVASKYLNDDAPKNKHWAHWTRGVFRLEEIAAIERQLLELLRFDLYSQTLS
jgi:G1/S-specific cyclin PLC1